MLEKGAEADHEDGCEKLNNETPPCGEVVAIVDKANYSKGGGEQGKD